jgi:hypothetical protein
MVAPEIRLGKPQSLFERGDKEKDFFAPAEN